MKFETRLQTTHNIFVCLFVCVFFFRWSLYIEETGLRKNIHWIVWGYSLERLATLSGMYTDISRNVRRLFTECLRTFPGMLAYIRWNVRGHFLKIFATISEFFGDISWNICGDFTQCNIPPIPHVARIPFSAPVLSLLCRCQLNKGLMKNKCIVVFIVKLLNILIYWKQ